jgi:hypothetical protein
VRERVQRLLRLAARTVKVLHVPLKARHICCALRWWNERPAWRDVRPGVPEIKPRQDRERKVPERPSSTHLYDRSSIRSQLGVPPSRSSAKRKRIRGQLHFQQLQLTMEFVDCSEMERQRRLPL